MLGKIPAAGRGFRGLVSYLLRGPAAKIRQSAPTGPHPTEQTPERQNAKRNRVLFVVTENLLTSDAEIAARVMRATANRSRRCKAPVYHFVISWGKEDRPDLATMRAVVNDACGDLGLDGLQRVVIGHDDTNHRHVHVVVNRIHPETGTAWNRRQDWVRLEVSLARLADKYGYERVPGRHNEQSRFLAMDKRSRDREYQLARRIGRSASMKWSPARIAAERPNLARIFDTARTWEDVHFALGTMGYRLHAKGAGLVIRDDAAELKLSQVSKAARLDALERRFGERFEPSFSLQKYVGRALQQVELPDAPASPKAIHVSTDAAHARGEPSVFFDDDDDPPRRRSRSR